MINGRNNYVVTKDGKRLLIFTPVHESRPDPLNVVLNWPALLKGDGK